MSILNQDYNEASFLTPELENIKIKSEAKQIYQRLLFGVREATQRFWVNQYFTPQQLADAAGTGAAELFQLHGIAINALEQAMPGSTAGIVSLIKPHTINPDGTVTIL